MANTDKGITLNSKDQQRLMVLNCVLAKQITVERGAQLLGLSERQMWRIVAAYKKEGAAALVVSGLRARHLPCGSYSGRAKPKLLRLRAFTPPLADIAGRQIAAGIEVVGQPVGSSVLVGSGI